MGTIIKPYTRIYTGDRILEDIQTQIEDSFRPFVESPIYDGILFESESLTSGSENLIEHGLGRAYRGWIITNRDQDCRIYRDSTTAFSVSKFLSLQTTANVNIGIWIF